MYALFWGSTVDSKTLEYGFRVICAGAPSLVLGPETTGRSYSNFLASAVGMSRVLPGGWGLQCSSCLGLFWFSFLVGD